MSDAKGAKNANSSVRSMSETNSVVIEVPAHSAPVRIIGDDGDWMNRVLMPGETLTIGKGERDSLGFPVVWEISGLSISHRGPHHYRVSENEREAALADHWERSNHPPSFLNSGIGTLDWLVGVGPHSGDATQAQASAAAAAIQWLGSNCGWCFLGEALAKCGYAITPIKARNR